MRHRVYSNKEQLVVGSTASRRTVRYYNTEFRDGNDRGNYVTKICCWIIFAQSQPSWFADRKKEIHTSYIPRDRDGIKYQRDGCILAMIIILTM